MIVSPLVCISLFEINFSSSSFHFPQDIRSTSDGSNVTTSVKWTGSISSNLISFDGGFQITLLPGGMYMGCPSDVAKSVQESKSFHLELCWLESPGKRQRLVRTYDVEGLAVSSTYFLETRQWVHETCCAVSDARPELYIQLLWRSMKGQEPESKLIHIFSLLSSGFGHLRRS